jgi:hypothetical protein
MPSITQPLTTQQQTRTSNLNSSFQTFVDKRPETAVPTPWIEYITPGKNGAKGNIGYIDENGAYQVEVNAYIYIYVDGFLINPPELNPDGSYKNIKSTVLSDASGNWATGDHFFDSIPAFREGQVIAFRAKAPLKQLSQRSIPYVIGGTPTPYNLGVLGDYGILRKPYEGESSVIGQFSYWLSHDPLTFNEPILDCNTRVFVYINGVHEGTSLPTIGEVFRNEIRGTNAVFPISDRISQEALQLLVGTEAVEVPLINITPSDLGVLVGDVDSLNTYFVFTAPENNVGVRLFKNGLRLHNGPDYHYSIDTETLLGFVLLATPPVPSDKLVLVFQYSIEFFTLDELPAGVIDGVNDTFELISVPEQDSLELFHNKVLLLPNVHYSLLGSKIEFLPGFIPAINDIIVADYQPSNTDIKPVSVSQLAQGPVDGNNRYFTFNKPNAIGNTHVYLNGLRLIEGINNDYLRIDNTILFNSWKTPVAGSRIQIGFYGVPISLKQLVSFLNNTTQFKENCLEASTYNVDSLINFFEFSGTKNGRNKQFSIPDMAQEVHVRTYVNGLRQKQNVDYTIDFNLNTITFANAPDPQDILLGFFSYQSSDQIIGETPLGVQNGVNTTFNLVYLPKATTVEVYRNGVHLSSINDYDYSIVGNTITFTSGAPEAEDIILVDYQLETAASTLVYNILPTGVIDGINKIFGFPVQQTGAAYQVYQNGQLLTPNVDYNINKNSIIFISRIPQAGDLILLNINLSKLFTNNLSDQLRILSPYPLQLNPGNSSQSFINSKIFGETSYLYPGKDENDEFYFWINRKTGYWKWSWYYPLTDTLKTFKTGQSITARAINTTPITYLTPV